MRRQQEWTEKIGEDSASIVRRILSVSHLRADHLNPDSDLRCKSIPSEDLAGVDTREHRREWTSTAIKNLDVAVSRQPNPQDVYISDTEFTVDELIDKLYEYSIGFQDKYYIAASIKQKLKPRQI